MKNCGMPPPLCILGRKFEQNNGQNLTEDLFYFIHLFIFIWYSPYFEPKPGLNLNEDLFFLVFNQFWEGKRTDSEWRNFSFGLHYS